jgi:hypothetical protein
MSITPRIVKILCLEITLLCITISCVFTTFSKVQVNSNKDIVFLSRIREPSTKGSISLINSDGAGFEQVGDGTDQMMPVWSPDKRSILTIFPILPGDLFSLYGHLIIYPQMSSCSSIYFYGRTRWATNSEIVTVRTDQKEGIPFHPQIVLWDVFRCKISKVIYEENTSDGFSDSDYSVNGVVAFTRHIEGADWITVFHDGDSVPVMIAQGFGPTWSPDGEEMVFTGFDGLYITDPEGKNVQKVVDLTAYYPVEDGSIQWGDWPPMAVWSPDGRFLLYHRLNKGTYELVKFEIATKTETVIYQGGMYPDWR